MSEMGAEPAEALEVLRAVWRSQGQKTTDLADESGELKSCKRMVEAGVGFDDFADGEEDITTGWRTRLEREGKLNQSGGSVRDLVLGPAEVH
jgi:hypothetical protein